MSIQTNLGRSGEQYVVFFPGVSAAYALTLAGEASAAGAMGSARA